MKFLIQLTPTAVGYEAYVLQSGRRGTNLLEGARISDEENARSEATRRLVRLAHGAVEVEWVGGSDARH